MITSNSITDLYLETLKLLKKEPIQPNGTREITNFSMCLTNPYNRKILSAGRNQSLKYICAELLWYVSGDKNTYFISHFSKFWDKLADNKGEVNSNYGNKIWHKKIFNPRTMKNLTQMEYVVEELARDKNSRRAVMMFNLIDEDYWQMSDTKDFPCTISAQFLIRDNKLHMIVNMRSNDIIFGWCNDVPFFTMIQELTLKKLQQKGYKYLEIGNYYHNCGSLHIYERHFNHLKDRRSTGNEDVFPRMTENTFFDLIAKLPIDRFSEFVLKQINSSN